MRIVSSNLQHGVPDPVGRPALVAALGPLRALNADVYAFQELDHRRWRTRFQHQPELVATGLDGTLVWAPAKRVLCGAQANALVVRGEVRSQAVLALDGPGERRISILATVVVAGGVWSVSTTHLPLEPRAAVGHLEASLDALARRPRPRVLVGDLNLRTDAVAQLAAARGWTLLRGGDTINARSTLDRRLDHVLVQGGTLVASGVEKLPVSDHLVVWADIEVAR